MTMASAEENISISASTRSRIIPKFGKGNPGIPLNTRNEIPDSSHNIPTRYSIILSLPLVSEAVLAFIPKSNGGIPVTVMTT